MIMKYWGLFFSPEEMKKINVDTDYELHITLQYFGMVGGQIPTPFTEGQEFEIAVDGDGVYTVDGVIMNTGVRVQLPDVLQAVFAHKVPHITTFFNADAGAKAADTAKCTWVPRTKTTVLTGVVKGFYMEPVEA